MTKKKDKESDPLPSSASSRQPPAPVHLAHSAAGAAHEEGGWVGSTVPPEAQKSMKRKRAAADAAAVPPPRLLNHPGEPTPAYHAALAEGGAAFLSPSPPKKQTSLPPLSEAFGGARYRPTPVKMSATYAGDKTLIWKAGICDPINRMIRQVVGVGVVSLSPGIYVKVSVSREREPVSLIGSLEIPEVSLHMMDMSQLNFPLNTAERLEAIEEAATLSPAPLEFRCVEGPEDITVQIDRFMVDWDYSFLNGTWLIRVPLGEGDPEHILRVTVNRDWFSHPGLTFRGWTCSHILLEAVNSRGIDDGEHTATREDSRYTLRVRLPDPTPGLDHDQGFGLYPG